MTQGETTKAEIYLRRAGMGNDAFAAQQSAVNVARATFANDGIDLKTVEVFRCRVNRNHDFDEVQGGTVIPMWDLYAEIEYTASAVE